MKKIILAFLVLASVARAEVAERIVAIVNDDVILLTDLSAFQSKLKKNGLVDDALLEFYDRKKIATDNKLLVNYLIDEKWSIPKFEDREYRHLLNGRWLKLETR